MNKPVKVTCFKQVHNIVTAAAQCRQEISVQDLKGAVADAKSILGLMNLDFSQPVEIFGEEYVAAFEDAYPGDPNRL